MEKGKLELLFESNGDWEVGIEKAVFEEVLQGVEGESRTVYGLWEKVFKWDHEVCQEQQGLPL